MLAVIREEHSFAADKKNARIPLWNAFVGPNLRFVFALIPRELDRRHVAARAVFVNGVHRGGCDFRMWRRAECFDGQRGFQLQRPERQVVPMAAEIAHGAVAEIPPAIPTRSGEIGMAKRTIWRGPEPKIPVELRRNGFAFGGAFKGPEAIALIALGFFFGLSTPCA